MLSITGELMSEDKVIATVKNGEITDCNETLLPLYLKRTKNLEGWLASRAIDTHRTNSRLLKKALRLHTADDAQIALAVNAATVTDRYWLEGRTLASVVEEALEGGVTFLQLREKKLDDEHFLQEAKELQALCRRYNVPFIVNDNVDVALAMGADGVHVGQHDMEAGNVRKLLGPDNHHQSLEGAYLKACVNYLLITDKPFSGSPACCGVNPEVASFLRAVAQRVVLDKR